MKKERKFRFIGDPHEYMEPELDKNGIYLGSHLFSDWDRDVEWHSDSFPEDWEEVTEQEGCYAIPKTETNRIPNQDQPASSMTKFELAVFMSIQGLTANPELLANSHEDNAEKAIEQATELFRQLENLKK